MKITLIILKLAAALSAVGVACAGLAVNFRSPYWFDEVFTGAMACQADFGSSARLTLHDVHPPTYVLFAHGLFSLFGCNLGVIRLSSVFFSAVGCVFLFLAVRRRHLNLLLGTTLLISGPAFWYYTVEARSYSFLFMTSCGLLFFSGRSDRRGQLLGVLMAFLAAIVNFFGIYLFLVAAVLAYRQRQALSRRDFGILIGTWCLALAVVAAIYVFQYDFVRQTMAGGMWIPKPAPADLVRLPMFFYGGSPLALALVGAILAVLILRAPGSAPAGRREAVITIGLFLCFVVGLYSLSYLRPMFVHRYTYFLFPLFDAGALALEGPTRPVVGREAGFQPLIAALCLVLLLTELRSTAKTYTAIRPVSWQNAAQNMRCAEDHRCLFVLDAPALKVIDDAQYRAIANFFAPQTGHFQAVRPEALDAAAPPAGPASLLYIQSFHPVVDIDELPPLRAGLCADSRRNLLGPIVCPL